MSDVMELAGDLLGKVGSPAYVRFYPDTKHLPMRSEREGRYVSIDIDMVEVIQKGARDGVKFEVERWFAQNKADVRAGRLPMEHAAHYEKMYGLWKQGQELPVEGVPIKGWAVIPLSQQEAIVHAGIRTVEDLAAMNAEAIGRIGMGAVMLKNKAQAWVAQAKDKGPATMEIAKLKQENQVMALNLEKLTAQVSALQREQSKTGQPIVPSEEEPQTGIGLHDILDVEPEKRSHHKK